MYKIITTKGLDRQVLLHNDMQIDQTGMPAVSLEPSMVNSWRAELSVRGQQDPLLVGYDNVVVELPGGARRFPAVSMAHFFLADTLRDIESICSPSDGAIFADFGCGSGFLGNYIAKNFLTGVHGKVIFADLFPESLEAALAAYLVNNNVSLEDLSRADIFGGARFEDPRSGDDYVLLDFKVGDIQQTVLGGSSIDVAVASPIYVPEICEVFPQAYQVFGSVAKAQGADFYFAHSSLADGVVEAAAQATGASLTTVRSQRRPLDTQTVDSSRYARPLNDASIERLVSLGLQVKGESNPSYLHDLRVSKMSY